MLITPRLLRKIWSLQPDFIVHIGAHLAEEAGAYAAQGWGEDGVVWVEADPDRSRECDRIVRGFRRHWVINSVLSDRQGETVTWYSAVNGQSSSMLRPTGHLAEYPEILFAPPTQMTSARFDMLGIDFPNGASVLVNLDIQGAELRALRGFGSLLAGVKWIYCEVNIADLYEGCARLGDLDEFLLGEGFSRVDIALTPHGWGDALYVASNALQKWTRSRRTARRIISFLEPKFTAVRARV